jgi:co-chaperonin GroES (HSP10)
MSSVTRLRALNDRIIFQFLQDTTGNMFHEKTKHGIIVAENANKQLSAPRWAKVISVGKDVSNEIKSGMYILIENLMWTNHTDFEWEKFWVTSEEKILLISDDNPLEHLVEHRNKYKY